MSKRNGGVRSGSGTHLARWEMDSYDKYENPKDITFSEAIYFNAWYVMFIML